MKATAAARTTVLWGLLGLLAAQSVCLTPVSFAEDAGRTPLQGTVTQSDAQKQRPTINPDELKVLEKGTPLDMTIATTLSTGLSVAGDEFFAKVNKDYVVDGKVVIPRGSLVHGVVQDMVDAKRAGRNGYVVTRFDNLITPDGREIPIDGDFSNRDSGLKAAAKVVGRSAGFTAVGGVVGALTVLKYGGLAAVAATEGYALAGGAAVGGAVGLGAALLTKGKSAFISPGSEIRVHLRDKLVLPTMNLPDATANDVTLPGLTVKLLGMRVQKDPFGEMNEMMLTLDITNQTPHTFSNFDIALEDEQGTLFYASPFGDTGLWFKKLIPNSHESGNLTFNVDNPKLQHTLVFYKQYTRQPLARITLTDARASAANAQNAGKRRS